MPLGIYLHVPFCRSKCGYCDFYSNPDLSGKAGYLNTLLKEIESYREKNLKAETLYLGGGTPSLLTPEELSELISACKEVFSVSGEITVEANPDSGDYAFLSAAKKAGVTRVSFGAQTAAESELRALGRRHSHAQTAKAVENAKAAGIDNISLDVMQGIPYQTADTLRQTLEAFASLEPSHISSYLLKIEEGTPFYRQQAWKLCADEDTAADFYLLTVKTLRELGYDQYEISNFSRPGKESRHNLNYWNCGEYLGLGPAAHSFFEGRRFFHPRSLCEYVASGGSNYVDDGPGGSPEEKLMLAMRLTKGIAFDEYPQFPLEKRAKPFLQAGYLKEENGCISFTPEGFLLSNSILARLME